ncbi:MAG: restriction endonuclease subunit S [Hylemonella sp.]|nr:restriction endonuclease subunit S [Hylemonella sp.]
MNEIPSTWQWSTIGEISAYIQRGKSPKYIDKSDLPVINQKCIRWGELQLQHLKYIHPEQFSAWDEARFIKAGDVLWNSTGTGTVGRAYHVKAADCTPSKVVDSHVTILRAAPELDARYLFNWIRGPEVQSKIEEMCDGTTNQIELSRTAIAATAIPIAPREEQTRIANQLDTLLTRIQSCNDRLDAIPALLKRFRQTVLKAATSGDLTVDWRRSNFGEDAASNFTEVRVGDPYSHVIRAPKLWKEASLGATCDFVGGSQPPKSTFTYENGDCLVRLIQIRDYKSDRHTTYIPKNLARRFCNKTDVMIGRYGPPIFQILRGLEGAYNVALMKAVPRTKDIDLEYLYVFLRGDQLLKFIEAGSDRTAGQDGVRKELLTPYPIFLPSLSEQAEIVRRVEGMFALADRMETRCTTARAQAQRLTPLVLAKAFRGELVPQDPSDESASALLERIEASTTAVSGKNKRKVPIAPKERSLKAINL